jgi:hypothetical protein
MTQRSFEPRGKSLDRSGVDRDAAGIAFGPAKQTDVRRFAFPRNVGFQIS